MRYFIFSMLLVGALAQGALCAPIEIGADLRSGPPRKDAGAGICATVEHLLPTAAQNATSVSASIVQLEQSVGNGAIDGKNSKPYKSLNFRNGRSGAAGDFTGAGSEESVLPFSDDPGALPRGDDKNILTRVRGYLNVATAGTVTLGINAEAGFRLLVGGVRVSRSQGQASGHYTQQVHVSVPGLYALEVVSYENDGPALLELSVADGAQAEVQGSKDALPPAYQRVPSTMLFTALSGQSSCVECRGDAECQVSKAGYCGDNRLCQDCIVSSHCGISCAACPARSPVCDGQACVECGADNDTLCRNKGMICNAATATCAPCTQDSQCTAGQICTAGLCQTPGAAPQCTVNDATACTRQHLVCDTAVQKCARCSADSQCGAEKVCDPKCGTCGAVVPVRRFTGGCSLTGPTASTTGTAGPLWLLACALLVLLPRRRRPFFFVAPGIFLFLQGGPARAQNLINALTFHPALGPENVITVEGSRTPGGLLPMANVLIEFANSPLRLVDGNGTLIANTVSTLTTLHLMGGLGVTRFLSFGLDLPIAVQQGFDDRTPADFVATAPRLYGVGDLRFVAKVRILNNRESGIGLAFVPQFTFPTGDNAGFRGDGAVGLEPRFSLDYRFRRGIFIALNAGFLFRTSQQELLNVKLGHQVTYGLGAYVPIIAGFGLGGEIIGATSVQNGIDTYSPLEGYAVARFIHRTGINLNLGGGAALRDAVGSAQYRLFASIGYLPLYREKPRKPEPPPILDHDGDGILDRDDRCPFVPGPPENGGCPDTDRDQDGIVDRLDKCPDQAEDRDGFEDEDGCPDPDNDKDGVLDKDDKCPNEAGPPENGGCPDTDRDKDGIVDRLDKCPDQPGVPENNGCPEVRKYISVTTRLIILKQKIHFATNKSDILPDSHPLLNEVIDVLKKSPQIEISIEGHTDSKGKPAHNLKLSEARAQAVLDFLVKGGTDPRRLARKGFGPTMPIADNKTAAGREANRRTEFHVTKGDFADTELLEDKKATEPGPAEPPPAGTDSEKK